MRKCDDDDETFLVARLAWIPSLPTRVCCSTVQLVLAKSSCKIVVDLSRFSEIRRAGTDPRGEIEEPAQPTN